MTISVANVDTSTDTFGQWVSKTNIIGTALSTKVVSTDSNTTTGNAAITGSFSANVLYGNTLSGGNSTLSSTLTITSNAAFQQNATFTGIRTSLGAASNVQINSGNSTHRVLVVNSAASNTLSVVKLGFSDIADANVTSPSNGQVLVYSTANSVWFNTSAININAASNSVIVGNVFSVGNSSVNVSVNSTMVAVNGSPALVRIFYANNVQAFP